MRRKELFDDDCKMIKNFGLHGLYENISALQGLKYTQIAVVYVIRR